MSAVEAVVKVASAPPRECPTMKTFHPPGSPVVASQSATRVPTAAWTLRHALRNPLCTICTAQNTGVVVVVTLDFSGQAPNK